MAAQMQGMAPQQPNAAGPGVDFDKQFLAEAENLAVVEHYSILDGVEERLLQGIKSR
jgi:ER membrane protein complex subunit 3